MKCCKIGTHECQVRTWSDSQEIAVDRCIVDIVDAMNASGIKTVASCCGHGEIDADVSLADGRVLKITKESLIHEPAGWPGEE